MRHDGSIKVLKDSILTLQYQKLLLPHRLRLIFILCWDNGQYQRRKTIEVVEIPIKQKMTRQKRFFVNLWKTLELIPYKGTLRPTIELERRTCCCEIFMPVTEFMKDMKYLTNEKESVDDNISEDNQRKISVNESLCPYYRLLWFQSKH